MPVRALPRAAGTGNVAHVRRYLVGLSHWGLRSPLHVNEVNAVLRDGGYGLRVEGSRSACYRLVGEGAGAGVPLGGAPTWAELHRTLVRLRRTRRRHDPNWLQALKLGLESEVARDAAGWVGLRRNRVEVMTPPDTGELDQAASAALALLTTESGEVSFPAEAVGRLGGRKIPGPPAERSAAGIVVGTVPPARMPEIPPPEPQPPEPQPPETRTTLLQTTRSREQVTLDRGCARRQLSAWQRMNAAVRSDPILRMHCTTQPIPLALADSWSGSAVLVRTAEPSPPHPQYSGGTVVVGLGTLLRSHDLLQQVMDNRFEWRENELDYFLEHFVRPLARVFRLALDQHRLALLTLDQQGVGVELSPELEATGRVVITEFSQVLREDELRSSDLRRGADALAGTLAELAATFSHLRFGDRSWDVRTVRAAVDQVLGTELRYLEPHTAEMLSGDHALQRFVHTVIPHQHQILDHVLRAVQERARRLRWHPGPQPVVLIELDLCGTLPGLARFTWDVRDVGGEVVFRTSTPERHRPQVWKKLADAGVPGGRLVCAPDEGHTDEGNDDGRQSEGGQADDVSRLPRVLGDVEVVAIFHRSPDQLRRLRKEFPQARTITVDDHVVRTFETSPRRKDHRGVQRGPLLSNARSLEELQLRELRVNRLAHRWAVHLDTDESLSLIRSVLADVDVAARRTGGNAVSRFGVEPGAIDPERTVLALHHVFTRKQFFMGSRSNYKPADAYRDMLTFVREQQPIDVIALGFPIKQSLNRLKAVGPMPDLAELGGLARLRELQQAVRAVYPPGLRINILTDGRHFRPRPPAATETYRSTLLRFAELVGITGYTSIRDIDQVAEERIGPGISDVRAGKINRYVHLLCKALRDFDIVRDPLRTLDAVDRIAQRLSGSASTPESAAVVAALRSFRGIMMSLVYSVPVYTPTDVDRMTWAKTVFDDVYHLTDSRVPPEVRHARGAALRRAWHTTLRYVAVLQVDEELGYDDMFPTRVRLTNSLARPGRCGFSYLGGAGLLPWHGTGVVDMRGHLAVDFAVSLLDQGFVPVYSDLLGPRQPWMMVPAEHTRTHTGGLRLDETFASSARLRRK